MRSTWSLRATAIVLAVAVIPAGTAIAGPLGPPQVLSTASAQMSLAAVGDREGNAVVVLRPGFGDPVLFERPAAGDWSGPHPLPGGGFRPSLQVAAAGSGAAAIAWRQDAGGRDGRIEVVVREAGVRSVLRWRSSGGARAVCAILRSVLTRAAGWSSPSRPVSPESRAAKLPVSRWPFAGLGRVRSAARSS